MYKELAEELDKRLAVGYPPTESGVELRLLQHIFTPEEAKLALNLSIMSESLERIHKRVKKTGMTIDELEEMLDNLVSKGAILGPTVLKSQAGGEKRYALAQFIVGMFDLQAGRLEKAYIKDAHEYIEQIFYSEFCKSDRPHQLRTIPVAKSVTHKQNVRPYDDIRHLIESSKGPMSIIDCVCKSGKDLLGGSCNVTENHKTCMQFGSTAEFYIERGLGQQVSKQKMLQLLEEFEEWGLVLQPTNSQTPNFICACCSDCCVTLQSVKRFPRPAEFYNLNYQAEVDSDSCQACGRCIDRCQMEAMSIIDDIAVVDRDRCIGCGLCVSKCSSNAIHLQKTEKEHVPPKTFSKTLQKIMLKKAGIFGNLKMVAKITLGKKV